MPKKKSVEENTRTVLLKAPTGIQGLDEITGGGLPQGRPTLICGGAGCGKTLLAMEFLVRGATQYNEPGVFLAFEETEAELTVNSASLGFAVDDLVRRRKLLIDHVHLERSEIEETGEYNLEGLFIRLDYAINSIGAKRVALDTIESLFSGLPNPMILRAELRRLFRWLKEKGVTAIITAERGDQTLSRQGLEEYVSDCVIVLEHRITDQTSTRLLRVVKYRGSMHGTNEYPFLIDAQGFAVLPITSLGLTHEVSSERISSGVPRLDAMLDGQGYFRGSTILVSGTAGTGKSSLAAHFAEAACRRGERVLYIPLEESPPQILRNMRSIGIDLEPWTRNGGLEFHAVRPTVFGLEMHLTTMYNAISTFNPAVVIVDPLNSFIIGEHAEEARAMLIRLIDFLKLRQITAFLTNLTAGGGALEQTDVAVSSLVDSWLLLRDSEIGGERNRTLYILKSRGMSHSNQVREFRLTDHGVELLDVYVGPEGVLTGSARLAQETKEQAAHLALQQELERKQAALERKRRVMEAQIAALQAEFQAEEIEWQHAISQGQARLTTIAQDRIDMAKSRQVEAAAQP